MKILVLGSNSYPINFFLKEINKSKFKPILFSKKFEHNDILNLSEISFYEKYFKDVKEQIDYSLNSIHIHKSTISNEIDINLNLTKKLAYAFKKQKIKNNIFISSVNAFLGAKSDYGISKLKSEEIYKTLENFIIIRPSTIVDIDYKKKIISGGKKGKSLVSLNNLISKSLFIPVPGNGKYLQTVCFGDDLGKFINHIITNNLFFNQITNFYSGELINYIDFINIILKFKNLKRLKIFIPKILIIKLIMIINKIFKNLEISTQNIENLTGQEIEYDSTKEIEKYFKLQKLKDIQ